MNFDNCIVCGSSENLNTSMIINVDNVKVSVNLCDDDAETTTPAIAKSSYFKRLDAINEFMNKAKELGINIDLNATNKLTVATETNPKIIKSINSTPQPIIDDGEFVDADKFDQSILTPKIGGQAGFASNQRPNDVKNISNELDIGKSKVKLDVIEGNGGMPTVIPKIRKDNLGTTSVNVVKTNDDLLQKKFKNSIANDNFDSATCSMCGGEGFISKSKNESITCPKCNGAGILS